MKKLKFDEDLIKIIVSTSLFTISLFLSSNTIFYFIVLAIAYIVIAYEMILNSMKNLLKGEFFDENTLMIIATIGAFCIQEYTEAVIVILLFEIGEYLSDFAVSNAKKAVTDLMNLRSDTIHLLINKKVTLQDIQQAKIDDLFLVYPGERIPLDGVVVEGTSYLDTSSLTGESIPKKVTVGDSVLSGFICNDQILKIRATSILETSTAHRILTLIEHSSEKKANTEKFITKFSKIYTPIIVSLAIFIAIIPIFFGTHWHNSLYTALVFLVMSCPCALVLSVPLAYFCGIGRASHEGVLVKGASELEKVENIHTILFDKTGTITKGCFEISSIHGNSCKKEKLLEIAAYGEYFSNHPIAKSIQRKYQKEIDTSRIQNFKEIRGKGIEVQFDKTLYWIGNFNFLEKHVILPNKIKDQEPLGTIVYIANEKEYLGYIVIADEIKKNVKRSIQKLKQLGIQNIGIVSGDREEVVCSVAKKVGIQTYYASLLPEDKIQVVEKYKNLGNTCFVGDGINDAPVIQISDVGIAMGGIGSDAAIEASDLVLMNDDIEKIVDIISISRMTKKFVIINIIFALFVKLVVLVLGILGSTPVWLAVFADVGVTLLCVLNTLQILKRKLK